MTQTDKQAQCSERVHDADTSWPRYHPCSRKGKVERDGKQYCTQHDPERVKARRAEQDAQWKAKYDARDKIYRRRAAEKHACEGISTKALEHGVVAELLAVLAIVAAKLHPRGYPVALSTIERDSIITTLAKARGEQA